MQQLQQRHSGQGIKRVTLILTPLGWQSAQATTPPQHFYPSSLLMTNHQHSGLQTVQ